MGLYIIRIIMLVILGWAGAFIGMTQGVEFSGVMGAAIGLAVGGAVWGLECYLRTISLQSYLYGLGGLLVGLLVAALGNVVVRTLSMQPAVVTQVLSLLLYVVCAYCGIMLGGP